MFFPLIKLMEQFKSKKSWKVVELKQICRELGLHVSENKEDLYKIINKYYSDSDKLEDSLNKLSINSVPDKVNYIAEVKEENYKLEELKQMCREMAVSSTGNKKVLCERLNKIYSKTPEKDINILKFWNTVIMSLPAEGNIIEDCEVITAMGNKIHPYIKQINLDDGENTFNFYLNKDYTYREILDVVTRGYMKEMEKIGNDDYELYLAIEKVRFNSVTGILYLEVTT